MIENWTVVGTISHDPSLLHSCAWLWVNGNHIVSKRLGGYPHFVYYSQSHSCESYLSSSSLFNPRLLSGVGIAHFVSSIVSQDLVLWILPDDRLTLRKTCRCSYFHWRLYVLYTKYLVCFPVGEDSLLSPYSFSSTKDVNTMEWVFWKWPCCGSDLLRATVRGPNLLIALLAESQGGQMAWP